MSTSQLEQLVAGGGLLPTDSMLEVMKFDVDPTFSGKLGANSLIANSLSWELMIASGSIPMSLNAAAVSGLTLS